MSRIGKSPIALPEGVKVEIADNNLITVSGKLGTLHQKVDPDITVAVEDGQILLQRPTEQKRHKALHGLYRSLLANMVKGVTEGFTIQQELVGVGNKAQANGQNLELSLGYSHSIILVLPPEIKLETVTERGKNPTIKMTCADKQLVGQVAAKIRSLRKPEPYKGKGVKYVGEEIKRKAGKAAAG
ncbi:MAG: 50S ribosomal protein L6 [Bacteroidales bacterium]|nr:50S ribosomal protein L6 [Bacteroidales bacterium]